MISTLRSEVRKLLSIRSTYIVLAVVLVLTAVFTYFGTAPQYQKNQDTNCHEQVSSSQTKDGKTKTTVVSDCKDQPLKVSPVLRQDQMESNVESTAQGIAIFLAVMAVLVMAHEYRYNTITYSLTLARKRWQVLFSKLIVVSGYVVVATLIAILLTIAFTDLAVSVKNLVLPAQTISWPATIGRTLFYDLGFALFGLGAITVLRNMVAGFVTLFGAFMVDGILSGILTHYQLEPSKYLPFDALARALAHNFSGVVSPTSAPEPLHAALTFVAYLLGLWIIAWYLFIKRDAN